MDNNFLKFKDSYYQNGYFVIKNFLDQKFVSETINEINNSNNTIKYFDNSNNLRRIEKLFNKG